MFQFAIVVPLIVAVIIYLVSFKDNKQVCENYVLASYLYALFYITLTAYLSFLIFLHYPYILKFIVKKDLGFYSYLGIFIFISILSFVLYLTTIMLPKKYVILKHILSLIVILLFSIMISVIFITIAPNELGIALILTVMLFVILTIIAWKFQDYIATKIPLLVFFIFLILIMVEAIMIYYNPNSIITTFIIGFVLVVLSYLLLVKTKKMIENAKECKDTPDYVSEGLGFWISFLNIFTQILELRIRRR
jgi:hypothetical protein